MENVNCEKIGAGLYDMMDDDLKGIVAFGMIPKEIMDFVVDCVKSKIGKDCAEKFDLDPKEIEKAISKDFINKFEREVTIAIFNRANELGKMIA
jgi:hypothetical protein